MADDDRFLARQFPRASRYHPRWVIENGMTGAGNTLWLAEWLAEASDFKPGIRVLDLGCGRAISSIFLAREYAVEVWATDLWISATENLRRIRDAGLGDRVYPIHADARSLPFGDAFFDAIVCLDAYPYFGTDDLYLNYLARFVKPGGLIGLAGAALRQELEGSVPEHLQALWTLDFWSIHSAEWWRRHWERTGIVDGTQADTMPEAWTLWRDWLRTAHPENETELAAVEADRGRFLGWFRMTARRNPGCPAGRLLLASHVPTVSRKVRSTAVAPG